MRKKIVAGNWKMNGTFDEACKLTSEIVEMLQSEGCGNADVILAPPYPFLHPVSRMVRETAIKVAAQNCSDKASGALTGEVSAAMIASCGAQFVIIGHSERRTLFGEENDLLLKKIQSALSHSLQVIYCVGESKSEREKKEHFNVINKQMEEVIFRLSESQLNQLIIAYEPVWAIGTGLTATPYQAQEMHAYIRQLLLQHFNENAADNMPILYGGSCNEHNARELFALPDVDGGLIGGASLKSRSFVTVIHSF